MTSAIVAGEPLSQEQTRAVLDRFYRDGFAVVPGVLTRQEIVSLCHRIDELFTDPTLAGTKYIQANFILRNTLELDQMFRDILVREPIINLAEAIVGANCQFCGQNVIRNLPGGTTISKWHVDDTVEFPLPDDVPRHDPHIRMPVNWFTVQMALSDIESVEHGPTQFVPGSHYSGRHPNDPDHPEFAGQGPVSAFCRAGDIYLQNNQCWHRGAPNLSDRTRYILQSQYAVRWAATRFGDYTRVPVPDEVLQHASERFLRVYGVRPAASRSY
ncbi:MAG: phytanoyl-CoA dioxygenase family protein [Candidatus Latescibacteria bacterium]|nr:phytanoyl-CoA dioxygenase family protein [Candidatus Latescibacterota bacterium]